MKLMVIYHPQDETSTPTEDFVEAIKRRSSKTVEVYSLETQEGANLARLYDATLYPCILVATDDGQLIKSWSGDLFPLVDEVIGYLNS